MSLPEEHVSIACGCGKLYRAAIKRMSARLICKACGERVRMPRVGALSERVRDKVLSEFGIDSDAARARYREERLRETPEPRVYACVLCEARILAAEAKGSFVGGELLCRACRDSALVIDRRAEAEKEDAEHWGRLAAVGARALGARRARLELLESLAYGAFVALGIFASAWVVFDVGLVPALMIGLLVGAVGGLAACARRKRFAVL